MMPVSVELGLRYSPTVNAAAPQSTGSPLVFSFGIYRQLNLADYTRLAS